MLLATWDRPRRYPEKLAARAHSMPWSGHGRRRRRTATHRAARAGRPPRPAPRVAAHSADRRRRLEPGRRPRLPRRPGPTWAEDYDWRPHEDRIRALPWTRAGRARVVHRRADEPTAPAVVLLHGWPDSVLRFERVLPLLTDVHVVIPALPGYPFSAPWRSRGCRRRRWPTSWPTCSRSSGTSAPSSPVGTSVRRRHVARHAASRTGSRRCTSPTCSVSRRRRTGCRSPTRSASTARGATVAAGRGRLPPGAGHQAAHARGCPRRLPGGAGGLDRREAAQLE